MKIHHESSWFYLGEIPDLIKFFIIKKYNVNKHSNIKDIYDAKYIAIPKKSNRIHENNIFLYNESNPDSDKFFIVNNFKNSKKISAIEAIKLISEHLTKR